MSIKGSPYRWFEAALERDDLASALAEARELPSINVGDALRLLLLIRVRDPARYEAAAVRFAGRLALERRPTLRQLQLANRGLDGGRRATSGRRA